MKQILDANGLDEQIAVRGIVSVCAWCKRVKLPGTEVWVGEQSVLSAGVQGMISHGLCPNCHAAMICETER